MIPILDLLEKFRDKGARFWVENGALRYRAPKEALSAEDLALLRARKVEILAILSDAQAGALPPIPRRAATTGPARLSLSQQRLWFLDQLEGPSPTYNIPAAMRLEGRLERAALAGAITVIGRRHEMLRLSVGAEDGVPIQRIAPDFTLVLEEEDLSALPESERLAAATQRAETFADRPFLLTAGPLFRAALLRLGAEDHLLVVVFHHLIADGWSMGVFSRELALAYGALAAGRQPELDPLPVQYGDFAEAQRKALDASALARETAYWRDKLAGAPPLLQILPELPRPAIQSYRGATLEFALDGALTETARSFARRSGASLFATLLAGFLALVRHYTGREDVVLGLPVAGRDRPEIEPLIGFFTQTLVLRIDLTGQPDFATLVERVRVALLDGFAHQDLPFERMVEAAGQARSPSYDPLVQTMFMAYDREMGRLDLPGLSSSAFPIPVHSAKCDLTFVVQEQPGAVRGQLIYNRDLFDAPAMVRLVGHYREILSNALAQPEMPVAHLRLLPQAERAQLLRQGIGPRLEFDPAKRLDDWVAETARHHPERLAVSDGTKRLTYGELLEGAEKLARRLVAAGAGPNRLVGLFLDRSTDLILAILAILRSGAGYLPLDPRHAGPRQGAMIADADVTLILSAHRVGIPPPEGASVLYLDEPWTEGPVFPTTGGLSSDLAYVIYTSGSTGKPRGVMIEHQAAVNLVAALEAALYRDDAAPLRVGLVASVAFDASVQQIFAALCLGHSLHIASDGARQDGQRLIDWLVNERIELADATPSLLAILIEAGLAARNDLSLRQLVVGGEPLPTALARAFFAGPLRGRTKLANIYGPSECCVDNLVLTLDGSHFPDTPSVPIGQPLANLRVYILDETGQPVAPGIKGEICLAGAGLGRGYLRLPELSAEKFAGHEDLGEARLYRTGDYGLWTEEGLVLCLGRLDDQVKIRGHRVEPGEVDALLRHHQDIEQAVTLLHRPAGGHGELISYVAGPAAGDIKGLRRWLGERLPDYLMPSRLIPIAKLPLTQNGKLDRAALPSPDTIVTAAAETRGRAAETPGEILLAEIWEGVLGGGPLGIEEEFFERGGDSIKALQVIARLRARGWQLPLRDLLARPQILALAPLLQPISQGAAVEAVAGESPLLPIQSWFLETFDGALSHYNQSLLLRPVEPIEPGRLRAALNSLIRRHPLLRARFRRDEAGAWLQSIGSVEPVSLTEIDLTGAAEPWAALDQAADRLQRDADLAHGPLFRAAYFRLPETERLFLVAHHLVVDGVSWRMLLDGLETAYRFGVTGDEPVAEGFAAWAARLAAEPVPTEEEDYWHEVEDSILPVLPPVPATAGPPREGERQSAKLVLSEALSRDLAGPAHGAYRTEINDLLLAGLALALAEVWPQPAAVPILLEGHGRDPLFSDLDLSDVVGWFTVQFPVVIPVVLGDNPGRQIKEAKEVLRRIPRHGIGYARTSKRRKAERMPQIRFNYLGALEASVSQGHFRWADEAAGAASDPAASVDCLLDVVGVSLDGAIRFELRYPPRHLDGAAVERLAEAYGRALERLVEHALTTEAGGPTPSDLDYAGFGIDSLDDFLSQLG